MEEMSMASAIMVQGSVQMVIAGLAFLIMRGGLLWMDRALHNTSSWFGVVYRGWPPHVQAAYHIGRLVAVAILLGLAIS